MDAETARREDELYFNTVDEFEQEMPRCAFCGDTNMRLYKFWCDKEEEEFDVCYFCAYDRLQEMDLRQLMEIVLEKQEWFPSEDISYLGDTILSLIDSNFECVFEESK